LKKTFFDCLQLGPMYDPLLEVLHSNDRSFKKTGQGSDEEIL